VSCRCYWCYCTEILITDWGEKMCGVFGGFSVSGIDPKLIAKLSKRACQRGQDSSGFIWHHRNRYEVIRSDFPITQTLNKKSLGVTSVFLGHSRLITNGYSDNQPVERDNVFVVHNGIVLNADEIWIFIGQKPKLSIDSEVIAALAIFYLESGFGFVELPGLILDKCIGVVSAVLIFPELGKLTLLSNNGSLYLGKTEREEFYFSSERFPLEEINCKNVKQIEIGVTVDIPIASEVTINEQKTTRSNLVPGLVKNLDKSKLLEYDEKFLIRCSKCILPSTMPFIQFDKDGVCNYCHHYVKRNIPKSTDQLRLILDNYRKRDAPDCIFPFSGGRDSSFGLHLAVKEFGLKPIAYTYDWGMVTDLGRRNISLMCSELGVENIVIAADISWKRKNIRLNLEAWLRSPNLGMLSILTAGDKHFFRHINSVRKQTRISMNLWSVNPLEVTHFKAGFLGIPPDFEEKSVYQSGLIKQLRYQKLRFKEMTKSPGYFNSSLIDTLAGEYFRSKKNKADYYHLFDYWRWDESEIEECLDEYGWERAADTSTTWRIGDGTAAFYNYVYHRVAGFSEHDTFRSNQIREGDISRDDALRFVKNENLPRYENIAWYLEVLDLDFEEVIRKVNAIPRLE
jgi:glucosamine--fructose-6-phosphate aminotransferase (isomerizing)